jgi:uncharacterized protein (DUF1778 family)
VYGHLAYISFKETSQMPRTATRQDRIHLRVNPRLKSTIERAAAYSDQTLTDFITKAAAEKAEAVVREQEVITLTPEAWEEFRRLLLDPPAPNEKLEEALAEHARVVRR